MAFWCDVPALILFYSCVNPLWFSALQLSINTQTDDHGAQFSDPFAKNTDFH